MLAYELLKWSNGELHISFFGLLIILLVAALLGHKDKRVTNNFWGNKEQEPNEEEAKGD